MTTDIGLNELRDMAHENAKAHGWYDGGERNIPEALALIHSEVSEALEEYRCGRMGTWKESSGKPAGFQIEIADTIIRIADLCGYLGIDLAAAVRAKHEFNQTREHRHGGKKA